MIKIYTYGSPVLRVKALPVAKFDAGLETMAENMIELMTIKNGVGLAAQQVGKTVRICVMYVPPQYDLDQPGGKRLNPDINRPLVLINPVFCGRAGAKSEKEGCLSIPGIFSAVHRAYEVSVSFNDLRGKERQIKARGLMARVIQHEIDHLDGILFVDRIPAIKKITLSARLKRLKREGVRDSAAD